MSEPISAIPEGALPDLRLAATNLLEAKRHLVRALSVGGAIQWNDCPRHVAAVGTMIQKTRELHTLCNVLIDPKSGQPQ